MNIAARPGSLTFEDFCALVQEDQKADLIDGVIYMASPEGTEANDLFVWLLYVLAGFVEEKDLGKVYASRVAFRLAERQGPEPDLAVVLKAHLGRVHRGFVQGPPDLAIEIVTPDSPERDYVHKRRQYQDGGVSEYWIVDEALQMVMLLRLAPTGRYRQVKPKRGVLRSEALPGFWLRPEWLWAPRPKKAEALAEILAG